jgi:hypothetical protein
MRPQTAMAAVFLLMVGSSAWLLREHSRGETSALDEADKEQGAPLAAPSAAAAPGEFDPEAARGAHGLAGGGVAAAKPAAVAPLGQAAGPAAAYAEPEAKTRRAAEAPADLAGGYAPPPPAASPAAEKQDPYGDKDKKSGALDGRSGKALADDEMAKQEGGMAGAMASYRAAKYDDATAGFDTLARQGDTNAELWAARAVREGHGCRTALTRFDHLGGMAIGTPAGNDATMDGALCYRSLGQIEASTQRLQRLLAYDGYSAKARAEIENNHRILVARKEAQSGAAAGGGGAAASKAAPKAPAKPSSNTERAKADKSLE